MSDWIGRIASLVLRGRIPHRGLTIDTNSPLVSDAIRTALLLRAYESAEQRFVREYVSSSNSVIELGASIGVMTCTLRRLIDPSQRVLAVEADPRLIPLIELNIAANATAPVILVNKAIDYSGAASVDFALGENNLGGSLKGDCQSVASVRVGAVRLAELVSELGVENYSIVSDVEGAEWQIWDNDRALLERAKMCVFELHDARDGRTPTDLLRELKHSNVFEVINTYGNVVAFRSRVAA